MDLPDETAEYAREETADWDEDLARSIYERGQELDYGLSDAMADELFARYPHEIDGQANCYEQAVFCYALADALELEPRFFETEQGSILHAHVDVEEDGERVIIDPFHGVHGTVEGYADTWLELEDGYRKTYHNITEKTEDEIATDIQDLRDHPEAMVRDGQRLVKWSDPEETVYDEVHFDPDHGRLERVISQSLVPSHLDHIIRMQTDYHEDGQEERIIFSDALNASWGDVSGEHQLAVLEDGELRVDDIDPEAADNIAKVLGYDGNGSDPMYDRDEHLMTLEDLRDRIAPFQDEYTGFRGESMVDRVDWLEDRQDEDPRTFHRHMDWLTHLRQHPDPVEEVDEDDVRTYLEAHQELLERVTSADHHDAYEQLKAAIDPDDVAPDDGTGLSPRQQAVAEEPSQWIGLLATDPELREALDRSGDLPALFDEYDRELEDPDDAFQTIVREWELDERELRYRVTLQDNGYATHNAVAEVRTTFEDDGSIAGRELSLRDTVKDKEHSYELARIDEDVLDHDHEQLREAIMEKSEELRSVTALNAPEPRTDRPIVDQNPFSIAGFSMFRDSEELPFLRTEEELQEFGELLETESEALAGSPYARYGLRREAEEELEYIKDLDGEHRTRLLQMNSMLSLRELDDHSVFTEFVQDRVPEFEDRLEEYSRRHIEFVYDDIEREAEKIRRTEQLMAEGIRSDDEPEVGPLLDSEDLEQLLQSAGSLADD